MSTVQPDYTQRRGQVSLYGLALQHHRRFRQLALLFAVLLAATFLLALSAVVLVDDGVAAFWIYVAIVACIVLCLLEVGYLVRYESQFIFKPSAALRRWVMQMCDGDFNATLQLDATHPDFQAMHLHTNNLSQAFDLLTSEMEELVDYQTLKLKQQNKALDTLYHVASASALESSTGNALRKAAKELSQLFESSRIDIVRVLAPTGAETGSEKLPEYELLSPESGMNRRFVDAALSTLWSQRYTANWAMQSVQQSVDIGSDDISGELQSGNVLALPVAYKSELYAAYVITAEDPYPLGQPETTRLLNSVGEQLGVSIARSRLDEQARSMKRLRERTDLANELHDSLAQTMSGLGFRINLLRESISKGCPQDIERDIGQLDAAAEEANAELRALIGNFRAPSEGQDIQIALQSLVERFTKESGIRAHFHADATAVELSQDEAVQTIRIVSEALANARKYSDANLVRVMMKHDQDQRLIVLVEDDGKGFVADDQQCSPGDHIGLSIMRERALKIAGSLTIESESGEGTRVELTFRPQYDGADAPSQ